MAKKEKYYFSFDDESYSGGSNTEDEAVEEATKEAGKDYKGALYIGKGTTLDSSAFVIIDHLLENINEQAQDQCGEWAEEYLLYLSDLEKDELQKLICDYLNKVDPVTFYNIEGVIKYKIVDGKAIEDTEVSL